MATFEAAQNSQTQGNATFEHNMEHRGVLCDNCETKICGFRFKCTQCPNFDLCHSCEIQGHHVGHVMMRIPFPEQSADAARQFYSSGVYADSFPFRRQRSCGSQRGFRCGNGISGMWEKLMRDIGQHSAENNFGQQSEKENTASNVPVDATAASLQMQELLNAWGIPVNVSELCSQFGYDVNSPRNSSEASSAPKGENDGKETSSSDQKNKSSDGIDHSGKTEQPPSSGGPSETVQPFPFGELLNNALQIPQVRQIIQGVTAAAENAARNTPSTSTSTPTAPTWTAVLSQLNGNPSVATKAANLKQQEDINASTLNQLLTMGFSNDDDWLNRLVIAKSGNLEAVLNALAPSGPANSS